MFLGYLEKQSVPPKVDVWVMEYSIRKLKAIRKPLWYLPILYKSELKDYYMRKAINEGSVVSVSSGMAKVR